MPESSGPDAMSDFGSEIFTLVTIAFCLWIGLLWLFRRVRHPLAGVLAALLSWAAAGLWAESLITVLKHNGLWPLL